jgi:sn-glycerol 3-phosphate transport system substrate-binding protein
MSVDQSKIKINVWLTDPARWATTEADAGESAAAEFNRLHPEYQVEIDLHDFRTMPAEVAAAAEQGNPPDIAELHHTVTRAALDSLGRDGTPLFTPVERALAGRTEILGHPVVIGDMLPAARDFFRYDGELTCVPRTFSTVVLFANLDILARAGISQMPRTWREVTAACQAVRKRPDGPEYGIAWPNCFLFFLQSLAQQGGLLADHDNGRSGRAEKVNLASTEMLGYVRWWQQLHRDGDYLYTGQPVDFPGCFTAFEEQRVAMVISSSVDASHLFGRGEQHGFRVKIGAMPHNDEVPLAGNMVGGFSMWLAAGLDRTKQDGALAFTQHINSPRRAADWARLHHRIPITRAAAELLDRDGWYAENPDRRVGGDQLEAADGSPAALGPLLGGHAGIVGELTAAMHDVLTTGADPADRFAEANERAQAILDAYHAHCDGPPRRTPSDLTVSI